jgi:replicative DNA helicase
MPGQRGRCLTASLVADELARRLDAKRIKREYRTTCPAHNDDNPSLDFHAENDRVVFNCRTAGCKSTDILAAMRSRFPDLTFGPRRAGSDEREWTIRDESGMPVAVHVRYVKSDGQKGYCWRLPSGEKGLAGKKSADLPLYGLPELVTARDEAAGDDAPLVVVTEGEKACDAARGMGYISVASVTGAASCPSDQSLEPLLGCRVVLWPDADVPGRAHMKRIRQRLIALGADVMGFICVPGAGKGDDAADYRGTRDEALAHITTELAADELPLDQIEQVAPRPSGATPSFRLVDLADAVDDAEAELQRFSIGDRSRQVPTGIASLDQALHGGFRRGTVALIGAPTGAGKTTLVTLLARAVVDSGSAVLLVSPEMSAAELAEREIIRQAGVPRADRAPWKLPERRDQAGDAHRHAVDDLRTRRGVLLLDEPGADMAMVEAAAAEAKARRPDLAAILLDYAQVLGEAGDSKTPRYLQVGSVGSRAVELARRLDVAVILTTQVNQVKGTDGPTFAVRESQVLEHVAALVMFLTVKYDEEPRTGRREVADTRLFATKHRHGGLFSLNLDYKPNLFTIRDCAPEQRRSA